MRLLEWLHSQRAKHQRHMAQAQSYVEHSQYFVREGNPIKGYHYLTLAIGEVVECGCDRSLWRASVREAITAEANQ